MPVIAAASSAGEDSGAPGCTTAMKNSVAASATAESSAAIASNAPTTSPRLDCASCPGDKTHPPPPPESILSHASAACSAADLRPARDDWFPPTDASRTRSEVARTSTIRGTSAHASAVLTSNL